MADYFTLSLVPFLLITLVYYLIFTPTVSTIPATPEAYAKHMRELGSYTRMAIYLTVVICLQYVSNILYVSSLCKGNISGNIGATTLYTFLPWLFVFGAAAAALLSYPSLKTAFADVVGYFCVAGSAHQLLSAILLPKEGGEGVTPAAQQLVARIWGNTSLLINDFHPETFQAQWTALKPLMTADAQREESELALKLFQIVQRKDAIGEAMWLAYTGVFASSLVFYLLSTRKCVKDAATIKKEHDAYLASLPPPTADDNTTTLPVAPEPEPW